MRLVLVSRWAGGPRSDWYPWLAQAVSGRFSEVLVPKMPRPERAEIAAWKQTLTELLAPGDALEDTVFVGHSVGCQAILRWLAEQEPGRRAAGFVGVAAWWKVVDPWQSLLPWLEHDYPIERARAAVGAAAVLISDNDQYTPDHAENAALWRDRLGAEVVLQPAAGHFNDKVQPGVLELLLRKFGV